MRSAVQGTGRDVAQTHSEAKSFGPSDLRKMLREPSGQVLGVELTPEGASMWVFDGLTEKTQPMNVECQACEREELGRKVSLAAMAVLDSCFDPQCAEGAKGIPMRPPAEACVALREPKCSGVDLSMTPDGRGLSGGLDPSSAKIIKGLTWGAFAAATTTTIGLFALNNTDAATFGSPSGIPVPHSLWYPAWTAAGFSITLLAVAIPITAIVDRKSTPMHSTAAGTSIATTNIQCPN